MDVKKSISIGLYAISVAFLTVIFIRFIWVNWAELASGANTGAFSNLSHLINALLSIPIWITAKMLRNIPLANKVYLILLMLFFMTVLLTPSSA